MRQVVKAIVCPNNPFGSDRSPFADHRVTVMLAGCMREVVIMKAINPDDAKAVVATMPECQYEDLQRLEVTFAHA
jgi:hypothetical protein